MAKTDDPLDGLEERLNDHAKSFEALLALTPAREYYGSQIDDGLDPSEQWNRKKQTKEQKRAAKKAKLDPANQKSALDVMKDQERKRKRELGIDDEQNEELTANSNASERNAGKKRQKQDMDDDDDNTSEVKRRAKVEKRKEARERKKEKKSVKKAKADAKKAGKQSTDTNDARPKHPHSEDATNPHSVNKAEDGEEEEDESDSEPVEHSTTDLAKLDFSGLGASDEDEDIDDKAADASSVPSSPMVDSPAFDVSTNHSEVSSSSSIDPNPTVEYLKPTTKTAPSNPQTTSHDSAAPQTSSPATLTKLKSSDDTSGFLSPKLNLPKINQAELQERLRLRIEELRARRKADGADGRPARSRQELLDQRRKKEEQRKAHKKELRRQAREDESRRREEQLRGSGSPLSASNIFSPRSPPDNTPQQNNFSFSRLAFADGSAADAALTHLADSKKARGPQDPQTALIAAEKRDARLAGLDEAKREELAEKDRWLHARQRAHGERVRDDTSLLKKALKRKEKAKTKSEREWKDREQAVVKGKEAKQKKRETNLLKRKEDKGGSGKKKGAPKGKKKARPGFEGRFKA